MKGSAKRAIIIICVVLLTSLSFYGYNIVFDKGKVSNCKVNISKSEYFTEKEIEKAVSAVKTKFRSFEGCTLLEISYSDEKQEKRTADGDYNTIVLTSNFVAVNPKGNSGMEKGNYKGWSWTLERSSKAGLWKVVNWGFA